MNDDAAEEEGEDAQNHIDLEAVPNRINTTALYHLPLHNSIYDELVFTKGAISTYIA